jgi:hypothetical protein
MPRVALPLPVPLAKAARRFQTWRENRTRRRIPEELWKTAAELATEYGVSRTARALRVQYYDLQKRIAGPAPVRLSSEEPGSAVTTPSFVEILTAAPAPPTECVVELENGSGAKMRIQVKGLGVPDVAALSRLFLEPRG